MQLALLETGAGGGGRDGTPRGCGHLPDSLEDTTLRETIGMGHGVAR